MRWRWGVFALGISLLILSVSSPWQFAAAQANRLSPSLAAFADDGGYGDYGFSAWLKPDGTVWVWPGTGIPEQVEGLDHVIAVAGGGQRDMMAIRDDGTVWTWFHNDETRWPQQVDGLKDIRVISGGRGHGLALDSTGVVWAWGYNEFGQLGNGATQGSLQPPSPVPNLSGVIDIAAGRTHSLALTQDGRVWAWGENSWGQLGNGVDMAGEGSGAVSVPGLVKNLSGVVDIAAGLRYSLALKSDGTVWAWGVNAQGQLGDGTLLHRIEPVQVSRLKKITAIAAGYYHALALQENSSLWAWGVNWNGELGIGTTDVVDGPVQVPAVGEIRAFAAGWTSSVLTENGEVLFWGDSFTSPENFGVPDPEPEVYSPSEAERTAWEAEHPHGIFPITTTQEIREVNRFMDVVCGPPIAPVTFQRERGAPCTHESRIRPPRVGATFASGRMVRWNVDPYLVDGEEFVQLRPLAEALGAHVGWDAATGLVTVTRGSDQFALRVGDQAVLHNGDAVDLGEPVQKIVGNTMVPLRLFTDLMGTLVSTYPNSRDRLMVLPDATWARGTVTAVADWRTLTVTQEDGMVLQFELEGYRYGWEGNKDRAKRRLEELVLGKRVLLEADEGGGRTNDGAQGYAYLDDGTMVQAMLVDTKDAGVDCNVTPPVRYSGMLQHIEKYRRYF